MTTAFLTLSVCVRGKSASGHTVKPRMRWCSPSRSLARLTMAAASSGSSSRKTACTCGPPSASSPITVASVTAGSAFSTSSTSSG